MFKGVLYSGDPAVRLSRGSLSGDTIRKVPARRGFPSLPFLTHLGPHEVLGRISVQHISQLNLSHSLPLESWPGGERATRQTLFDPFFSGSLVLLSRGSFPGRPPKNVEITHTPSESNNGKFCGRRKTCRFGRRRKRLSNVIQRREPHGGRGASRKVRRVHLKIHPKISGIGFSQTLRSQPDWVPNQTIGFGPDPSYPTLHMRVQGRLGSSKFLVAAASCRLYTGIIMQDGMAHSKTGFPLP